MNLRTKNYGLASIDDSVNGSIQRFEDGGKLITATRNNPDNTRTSRTIITRKQK